MSESRRVQRVEKELREIVSSFVVKAMPSSFLSVTAVRVSKDLRQAKVYVTKIGSSEIDPVTMEELDHHAPEVQRQISRKLHMKYCPKLTFFNDESVEMQTKVDSLLADIHRKKN